MVYLSVTYQIQIHIQIQQNIHLIPSLLGLRDTIIWHFACHSDDDNNRLNNTKASLKYDIYVNCPWYLHYVQSL